MKNNEELRMFGEISLVIVLVLAVLDLLVTGVARKHRDHRGVSPERTICPTISRFQLFPKRYRGKADANDAGAGM